MAKERPIPFSAPMVRAILDGHKTQTRRILKFDSPRIDDIHLIQGDWFGIADLGMCNGVSGPVEQIKWSYGQPGDRLWVREAWRVAACYDDKSGAKLTGILSRRNVQYETAADTFLHHTAAGRYRHARFMPRWASRITLEIVNVRVERLQDISEVDAAAEGAEVGKYYDGASRETMTYREAFRDLWQSINGAESWAANPWVWVLEFRRIKP